MKHLSEALAILAIALTVSVPVLLAMAAWLTDWRLAGIACAAILAAVILGTLSLGAASVGKADLKASADTRPKRPVSGIWPNHDGEG